MSFYNGGFMGTTNEDEQIYTAQMQRSRYNMPSTTIINIVIVVNILLTIGIIVYWIINGFGEKSVEMVKGVANSRIKVDIVKDGGAAGSIIVIIFIILTLIAVFLYFVVFPLFFNWSNVLRPDYNLMNTMQFGY